MMDNYVEYSFYTDEFGGTLVTEEQWKSLIIRAELAYDNYTRKYELTRRLLSEDGKGAMAIKITLCEMVENISKYDALIDEAQIADVANAKGISSESVKDHTITFDKTNVNSTSKLEVQSNTMNTVIMNRYLGQFGLLYRGIE